MPFNHNTKKRVSGIIWTLIVLAILSIFFIRALELRLPLLDKPYWEDEIHENHTLLSSISVSHLRQKTYFLMSPILSYLIKYKIWFTLFECHELGLRLPSLIYGMATICILFIFFVFWGKQQKYPVFLIALCTLIILMWITYNEVEIYYAAEARFYSFVSMVSLIWFGVYFLTRPQYYTLALTSLVFANTHFFALPLILTAYMCEVIIAIKKRDGKSVIIHILTVCLIILMTVSINYYAWKFLFLRPPGKVSNTFLASIIPGFGLVKMYYTEYLSLPFSFPFYIIFLPLLPFIREERIQKLFFFIFLTLPTLFILYRMNSNYEYHLRYYSPYFGVGAVLLIYFLDSVYRIVVFCVDKGISAFKSSRFSHSVQQLFKIPRINMSKTTLVLLVFTLLFVSKIISFGQQPRLIVKEWQNMSLPPEENFSDYYFAYENLKKLKKPFFLINARQWTDDRIHTYMNYIGKPFEINYSVVDSVGKALPPRKARKLLKTFLQTYPTGVVVLDQIEYDCPGYNISLDSLPVPVKRISNCIVVIENVSSVGQIEEIAQKLNFKRVPHFFKRKTSP